MEGSDWPTGPANTSAVEGGGIGELPLTRMSWESDNVGVLIYFVTDGKGSSIRVEAVVDGDEVHMG